VNNHYPPPFVRGPDGRPWHSWRVLVLPYIEQNELFKQYRFDEPWDGPNNRRLAARMPRIFEFHSAKAPGNTTTNYLAVVGDETVWHPSKRAQSGGVSDGLSTTILIVENRGAGVHWMEPRDLTFADFDPTVNSPAGVSSPYNDPAVAMLDGSLRHLRTGLRPDVLRALLTARGGEPLAETEAGGWEFLPDGRDRPLRER
jgi:hypothetical protein